MPAARNIAAPAKPTVRRSRRLAEAPPAKVDGRRLRTAATRQRIVDSVIDLQREGHVRPAMQAIADRAGVSLRAVFQHFPEKSQLTQAVLEELLHRLHFEPPPPQIATRAGLGERMERFLDERVELLEALTPHRRAANQLLPASPVLQRRRASVRRLYQGQVATWFEPELSGLPDELRPRWLDALSTLTDWEMWESLRTYPTRSIAEARGLLQLLLQAALRQIEAAARGRER